MISFFPPPLFIMIIDLLDLQVRTHDIKIFEYLLSIFHGCFKLICFIGLWNKSVLNVSLWLKLDMSFVIQTRKLNPIKPNPNPNWLKHKTNMKWKHSELEMVWTSNLKWPEFEVIRIRNDLNSKWLDLKN